MANRTQGIMASRSYTTLDDAIGALGWGVIEVAIIVNTSGNKFVIACGLGLWVP